MTQVRETEVNDYNKYRGRCKEMVDEAIALDPSLIAVRGHYWCWQWGKQAHWWCVRPNGEIYDPSIGQFPKPHIGDYTVFSGLIACDECGTEVKEAEATINGYYGFCTYSCAMRFVGL